MAPRHCENITIPKRKCPVTSFKAPDTRNAEIISDIFKKKWRLGKTIGLGAFGQIFLASDELLKPVTPDTAFIVKMEPHESGPLFVERNFYLRAAQRENIQEWLQSKRRATVGIPSIHSFGSCIYKGEKMRFLVLPKLGTSIQAMLTKHGNKFHVKTAFTIAIHVIDALEFVHHKGYIHADIKAANLVLGLDRPSLAPVYLIDYGLVARFKNRDGSLKEYVQDIRVANAGTVEFSSRDSHNGVICRRSDLESLGYCMVSWLGGELPWRDLISNPEQVLTAKENAMQDVNSFLSNAFPGRNPPSVLLDYFAYVNSMDFATKPDYAYIKKLLRAEIIRAGFLCDLKVTFDSHAKLNKKAFKRIAERENIMPPKKKVRLDTSTRKPCSDYNEITSRVTRKVDKGINSENFNWATVIAGDPDKIARSISQKQRPRTRKKSDDSIVSPKTYPVSDLSNPTYAMKRIMHKTPEVQRRNSRGNDSHPSTNGPPLTYAMEEVLALKRPQKRVLRSSSRKTVK